ncbi:unnamed protein product, partial [Gulo gulo]
FSSPVFNPLLSPRRDQHNRTPPKSKNVIVVRDTRPRGGNKPSGAADPDRDESPGKAEGPACGGAATLPGWAPSTGAARRPRRHKP